MFYSYELIESLLICQICENRLYDPRLVPCGQTFCNKCIVGTSGDDFSCLCKNRHKIPLGGFPKNLTTANFLNQKAENVSRGEKAKELRDNLDKIFNEIIKIKHDLTQNEYLIKEHCFSLRTRIDFITEITIQNIQKQRDDLIQEVDEYEKGLLNNSKKDNRLLTQLNNKISEIVEFYTKCQALFQKYDIDESDISKALEECNNYLGQIDKYRNQKNRYIYNNKILKFEQNDQEFQPLGSIVFNSLYGYTDLSYQANFDLQSFSYFNSRSKIDIGFFEDTKIIISNYDRNRNYQINIFDLVKRKIYISKEFPLRYGGIESVKSYVFKHDIILVAVKFESSSIFHTLRIKELKFTTKLESRLDVLDIDSTSLFHYFLVRENQICKVVIYDHDFNYIKNFNPVDYVISHETTSLRVTQDDLILFEEKSRKITLFKIHSEIYSESFTIDGDVFLVYNNKSIVSYNSYCKSLCYYNSGGTKIKEDKVNIEASPTSVKGSETNLVFYDEETDKIYY